jgi:hypothetical protein
VKEFVITAAALQVEVLNGGPRLSEILGPAAVVIAALLGAAFASRYASKNVAKELLAADDRQRRELHHDQRMRAREATRATIDEVTNALTRAMDTYAIYAGESMTVEDILNDLKAADDESEEKKKIEAAHDRHLGILTEKMLDSHNANLQLSPARLRLRLRFGEGHEVLTTYETACALIRKCNESERAHGVALRSKEQLAAVENLRRQVAPQLTAYVNAVRAWLDAEVAPDEDRVGR